MIAIPEVLVRHLRDEYRIVGEVGQGGMGIVYRARDLRHDRDVAIKVLRNEIGAILGADRFLREIRIEASLQHPNILPVLASGEVDGRLYCVLPFVDGPTLRGLLTSEGPLPVERAVSIASDLARALSCAHAAGVVHRDIKPENVLLSGGIALLADFGIARAANALGGERLTSEGIVIGTPAYMSPEQAAGEPLDHRSDLYSLGIVIYEMLAGEPPFSGKTANSLRARHQAEIAVPIDALRPGISPELSLLVQRAIAKLPVDRFQSAEAMVEALEGRWTPPLAPRARRRSLARLGLAVAGLGLAAAIGYQLLRPRTALDTNRVVVFPVPDQSAGADSVRFNLDVPYAIEVALDHTAPLSWIHGWGWLGEDIRRDPIRLTGPRMQAVARDRGARFYIDGAVRRTSSNVRLVLQLHDALTGTTVLTEGSEASASNPDLASLSIQAVSKMLLRWLAAGRHEALTALAARRPGAVALQVQGEQEYRQARFKSAFDLFSRSINEDSTWGYAAVKAAQAASWMARRPEAARFIGLALRHANTLPGQYAVFARGLDAYLGGRAAEAESLFTQVTAAVPDWEEAHMALGDTYYHLLPPRANLGGLARRSFERALEADSGFTPPLRHLAQMSFRAGDLVRGDAMLARLARAGADSLGVRELVLMGDCIQRGASNPGWLNRLSGDPLSSIGAAQQLAFGGAKSPCAEAVYRRLLTTPDLPEGYSWTALAGLQGILVSGRRFDEAARILDSALAAGSGAVRFLYLIESGEAPILEARAESTAAFARQVYQNDYRDAPAYTRWALGAWHARRGDRDIVAQLARLAVAEARSGDRRLRLIAASLEAHAALARGDTTQAISRLQRLAPTAPLDSLEGDLLEPLAVERITLAELLLARRRWSEAGAVADWFDHGDLVFGPFVARSLEVRYRAALGLEDREAAGRYRTRLQQIGRADLIGPR